MPLDSPLFLFLFLPALLGLFALAPVRTRPALFCLASLAWYALGDFAHTALLLGAMLGNGFLAASLEQSGGRTRKRLLGLGVALNLGLLVWAKYLGLLAQIPGLDGLAALKPASPPLGVSFFTFTAIAYLVDVHRGQVAAERDPFRLGLFLAAFPKMAAGPIARLRDVKPGPELRPAPSLEDVRAGLARFAVGLGKKTLLAQTLAPLADAAFGQSSGNLDAGTAWLGLLAYSLQLYLDFSGYSDMAIGLGRVFGLRFPENFDHPYAAKSVREFWRRWHISLSTWFRDYLYIPLGGGRVAPWKIHRNLFLVFGLCGLWHGASLTFLVWGLWHGLFLSLERGRIGAMLDRAPTPLARLWTLLAVGLGWVFFRAPDFGAAVGYFKAMLGMNGFDFAYTWMLRVDRFFLLVLAISLLVALPTARRLEARVNVLAPALVPILARLVPPAILALSILQLAQGTHTPFIYAQF